MDKRDEMLHEVKFENMRCLEALRNKLSCYYCVGTEADKATHVGNEKQKYQTTFACGKNK